jgi:hypothetical protein
MLIQWKWSGPYWRKLCARHAHATSIVREVVVVFGFSWLAEKVMIKFVGKDIRQIVVKVEIVGR